MRVLIATVVNALATLPLRLVVTVGPAGDPAALGDQPANVCVTRYIPQVADIIATRFAPT